MKVNKDDQLALNKLNREEIVQFLLEIIKHPQKCVDFPITQWLTKYESFNVRPNFTEAALLIESAGQIYSRKVTFLEDLILSIAKGTSASTSEINSECPTQKKRRKKIIQIDVNEIECIPKEIRIKSLDDQLCEKLNTNTEEFNEKLEKTISIYKKDHKSNQLKTLAYPKLRVAMANQVNSGAIFGKHRICDKDNDSDSRQNYKVFMNYLNEENHSIGKIVQKTNINKKNNIDDFDYDVDNPCPYIKESQFHWYVSATYLKETYELNVENNNHYLNMLKYQNEIRNILLLDDDILYNFQNGKQLNNILCGKQQIDESEFDDSGEINDDNDDDEFDDSGKNCSGISEHDSGFYTQSSSTTLTNSSLSSMDISTSLNTTNESDDDQIRANSDISSQVIDELVMNSANTTQNTTISTTTPNESLSNNSLNNLSMEESVNINSSLDLTIPPDPSLPLDEQLSFDDMDKFSNTIDGFTSTNNNTLNLSTTTTTTGDSNFDDNNLIVPCTENSQIENSDLNELSFFEQQSGEENLQIDNQEKSNIRDSIDTGINLCISHLDECDRAMLTLTPVVELFDIFGSMGSLIEEQDKKDFILDLNSEFQNVYKIGDENAMVSTILLDGTPQPHLPKVQTKLSPLKLNIFKIPESKLRHKLLFSLPKDDFEIWKNKYSQSKRKGSPPPTLVDPKRTKMTLINPLMNQRLRDNSSIERELDFHGFDPQMSPLIPGSLQNQTNPDCLSANSLRSSFSFDSGHVDGTPIDTDKEDDNSLRTSPIPTENIVNGDGGGVDCGIDVSTGGGDVNDEINIINKNKENDDIPEKGIKNEVNYETIINNNENTEEKNIETESTTSIIDSAIVDDYTDDPDKSIEKNTTDDLLNNNDDANNDNNDDNDNSSSTDQQMNKSSEQLLDQINSKRLAKLDEMKELNDRVRQWHESLRPAILLSQQRNHFDIHDFGTKIINFLKCSTNVTATFQDVLTNNDESYTANYFLSLLQLVNARNVDLIINRNDDNKHEAFKYENISIKLLSEVRHKI